MSNENLLIVDLLSILPSEIDLSFQAPSLDDEFMIRVSETTEFEHLRLFKIKPSNVDEFVRRVEQLAIHEYFHYIQFKKEGTLLFEGFDGVEFGIVSKKVELPIWFRDRYIKTGDCTVARDW